MRVYTLHHPTGADVLQEDPVLVREGFNWYAAVFTGLWALWAGMWLVALLLFAAAAALLIGLELAGAERSVELAGIRFSAIVGFCANDWRRAKLHRRGYRLQGVVAATNMDSARRRWFDLHPPGGIAGVGF
ncbi:MAG: DUF2628 domain-containing protein [Proteobacteria bacterium]|nr:DUF2628 domain-containing protein [Pseudomonadota bacterium]